MQIGAYCLSYPRASLRWVLACWDEQTERAPLWLHYSQRATLGEARRQAAARAIREHGLTRDDWLIVLDDDDFYSRHHVQQIREAIERHPGADIVGQSRHGEQLSADRIDLVPVTPDFDQNVGPGGVGPHAGLAFRVGAYLNAGGYPIDAGYPGTVPEDVPLMLAIRRASPGGFGALRLCTYVHSMHLGAHGGRGQQTPPSERLAPTDVYPEPRADHDRLQQWCDSH